METRIIFSTLLNFTGVLIMAYFSIRAYSVLTGFKAKVTILSVIVSIFFCYLQYMNAISNYTIVKPIIALNIMILINLIIYKKHVLKIILNTFAFYIISLINDIILTIFLVNNYKNLFVYDHSYILKFLLTILICLINMLVIKIYIIVKKKYRFANQLESKLIIFIMILLFFLFCDLILISEFSIKNYFINILILLTILVFLSIAMVQYIKFKKAEEKELLLLKFMKEYEKIIDKDRIDRHEMLNNLLLIKSLTTFEDKRFNDTIDEIIRIYDNNTNNSISKLYKLPSGLKGLIYYKLYNLQLNKIKPEIFISKKVINKIDSLENRTYLEVYKILGVLLDNAVEACISSQNKFLMLDIYEENKKIYFYIENSKYGKIEINQIVKKGYSTKGNKRGLGLYIVNRIVEKRKNLHLEQYINNANHFVSILSVD